MSSAISVRIPESQAGQCHKIRIPHWLRVLPTELWASYLEVGTICRRTSEVSDSRWRHFYSVIGTKAQCESPFNCAYEILLLTYHIVSGRRSDCTCTNSTPNKPNNQSINQNTFL